VKRPAVAGQRFTREDGDRIVLVTLNVNRDKGYGNALIRVPATGYVTV